MPERRATKMAENHQMRSETERREERESRNGRGSGARNRKNNGGKRRNNDKSSNTDGQKISCLRCSSEEKLKNINKKFNSVHTFIYKK